MAIPFFFNKLSLLTFAGSFVVRVSLFREKEINGERMLYCGMRRGYFTKNK
jgi:hypothetical protein